MEFSHFWTQNKISRLWPREDEMGPPSHEGAMHHKHMYTHSSPFCLFLRNVPWKCRSDKERRKKKRRNFLPLSITLPKTEASRSSVLQFQRWFRSWNWHSLTPSWTPSLKLIITSWWMRHNRFCLPTRPGMLLHIIRAPTMWSGYWLMNLQKHICYH